MSSPPSDLSRHVPPASILASAGITVKGVTPEVTECPFCHKRSMTIYMDPVLFGTSRWLRCSGCDFKGDTIETYGRMNDICDVREAFRRVVTDGLFGAAWNEVTPELIESYIRNYPDHRCRLNRIWDRLRETLSIDNPVMVERIQNEHLWGGGCHTTKHRFGQFLGGGLRRDMISIFEDRKIVPRKGYHTNLVVNYQDVPGRICAFQFLGSSEDRMRYFPNNSGHTGSRSEGGLAMLDVLEPYDGTVFAMGNARLALMLHMRHFTTHGEALKLVVYNQNTRNSWNSISARRVIFWGPNPSHQVFSQVRQLGLDAGYVTSKPDPYNRSDEFHKYLYDTPSEAIPQRMEHFARPWPEALAIAVVDRGMDEAFLRDLHVTLQFRHDERAAILDAFPPRCRNQAEHCLNEGKTVLSVATGSSNVLEIDGGWYLSSGNRQRELISNAIVRVVREIVDEDSKEIFWEGFVRFLGEDVPFYESVRNMAANMREWILNATGAANLGRPIIQPSWGKRLFELAQQFSTPRRVHGSSKLGIRPDGCILFPNFVIRDGRAREQKTIFRSSELPAAKVGLPVKRKFRDCDKPCLERSLYTAQAAALVWGMVAPVFGEQPQPVAVTGPLGCAARRVARHLAKAAGMQRTELDADCRFSLEMAQKQAGVHGYPYFIDTRAPGMLKNWNRSCSGHVFLTCEVPEAAVLCTGTQWISIGSMSMASETCALAPVDDMLWYLADLQRRKFELPDAPTRVESVLADMCLWYEGYLRMEDKGRYHDARGVMICDMSPSRAAVELYCHLYKRRQISREYAPVMEGLAANGVAMDRKRGMLVDVEAKCVFLPRKSFHTAITQARWPKPDLVRISEDFSAKGMIKATDDSLDGWVIDLDAWETLVTSWQNRNS